ncbi:MAG: N-acetylmuramoyl-L-alanine amidase [Selenomonadaceae bacterium]|nr:N-acetylmuramoyl-L-alanine amidase [Selenomonadaceae bacterium]
MAETKTFHLDGGTKGHRLVIDVGNADFKPNPEANKPNADALKAQQERELKERQERELKERQDHELKESQERELKESQERELKERQERELKEQQERELARREQELAQRERELKEREEQELKKQQERELKERQEQELKERQERERELARREQELKERERELKEREEKELKKQQERELKEREKKERELKKQQERELKEKRERDIKEQREREKQLKEKEKQERREKKDRDKNKDKDDEKITEVEEPFKGLENDLGEITALSGKKIVIDPGHGGNDAGAIGPTGVMEKTVTLKVALELRRLLEAEGAQVILTREGDTTVSAKGAKASDIEELGARCEVANRIGADIFISIHADSFTRPEARGTTGYYYSKSTSGRGQKLADCIRRNLVEQLGTPSRGTQPCNFYVVKNTDMPATLIELGFISNKEEEQLLNSKEGVQKAAQGILDGIEDYFG